MNDRSRIPSLLVVGPLAFRERAATLLERFAPGHFKLQSREALTDLGGWDADIVFFRLSSSSPDQLQSMLGFLAQGNRAEAIAVVAEGEEDLGVGAVSRGALNYIVDREEEYEVAARLAKTSCARAHQKPLDASIISRRFESADSFTALCHPIIDLKDMSVYGWEFLSRGPAGPYNLPARFFRWGRDHDRLIEFDLACLDAGIAAAQAGSFQEQLHFNLFPQTLLVDEILPRLEVLSALGQHRACIEISEPSLASMPNGLGDGRQRLHDHNIQLAIDDIGFQARGFGLVRDSKPEILKIDRRVTSNLTRHQAKRDIVSASLKLGANLDAIVIVEGVELDSELELLRSMGVRYAQGFYWGKPTLPDKAEKHVKLGDSSKEQS